jgi:threonine dehydrogenase-like Zn-dependent dehydrogenase
VLGHEITGEVVDTGPDVEFIKVGDLCSVPFNISCGRCRNCKERKTGVCLNVNPIGPVRPTATSTWAAGSAVSPNTSWSRTPTGTCLKFP